MSGTGSGDRDSGMRTEQERLRTFQRWPSDAPVRPAELARAGFYYLGPGDTVRCFCCHGMLRCWADGDRALGEHRRHFPHCDFARPSDAVDGQFLSQLQRMTVDDQVVSGQAMYPEMESEDSRLTSYHNWPPGASVQPGALARAGFFYTGHGDNVKCYFCDGGLRNWEPGDDPWQEHAKWFPRCEFLLQSRGHEYVSIVQQSFFNMAETVGGTQGPVARSANPGNDMGVAGQGLSAALLSPVVQTVLQMGFRAPLVESLVQTRYLLTGRQYSSASDLVADVLQAEEEERQRGEPSTEPVERQGTSGGGIRAQVAAREKGLANLSAEEQLRQLQEERTCKVCMDKTVSIVFIPCGHLVVCSDCAASLRHCPICRAIIRGSVRAFMS
ncbi:baculoviral IAP repeat-containing protein 7 [Denticeps clupeoides]|uniref:baculoviral IAP repeat-containing protein 7 n=1 Tax=Denticeps clupeoides TaxID=299321 RepID=UPI0010A51A4D|nr:baculoviral IAP repeat-containing protein 7-B-like [Denticeps clupeoides]